MGRAVLFSDLGTGSNVYSLYGVSGVISGSSSPEGGSYTTAQLFTVGGAGAQAVGQIDLGVTYIDPPYTFYASLWTDSSGAPGTQVAGAFWNNLSTNEAVFTCCSLVTISGISGVTLTGGQSYFLVLGPVSISDTSLNVWMFNTVGAVGDYQYSNNGGSSWVDEGAPGPLSAFDVLGTPEPASLGLSGLGLAGMFLLRGRRRGLSR